MYVGINYQILPVLKLAESGITINLISFREMIINLNGEVKDDIICFEAAPIYFGSSQYIHVNELAIQWKHTVSNINGLIWSSLVDRSSVNQFQQILFFYQKEESNFVHYTPTHTAKYKIQCPSLQASVFNIQLSEKHEIEKVYIQLEVTNARIQ